MLAINSHDACNSHYMIEETWKRTRLVARDRIQNGGEYLHNLSCLSHLNLSAFVQKTERLMIR